MTMFVVNQKSLVILLLTNHKETSMQTIFNIFNPNNQLPPKGIVDIVDIHDRNYFNIFLDGELVEQIYKDDWIPKVLKRSFINNCVKKSGVDAENIRFVLFDLYLFGETLLPDYDSNDYESYDDIISAVKKHPGAKPTYGNYVEFLATGISELETKV